MPDLLFASCAALPHGDEDAAELLAAFDGVGLRARWADWADPSVRWDQAAATIVRSTWDYAPRRPEFLTWARTVPRLHNPAPVIAWNSDKRYLGELAAAAIPTVPSIWLEPGAALPQIEVEIVLKPTVGAGSRGAGRFGPAEHAAAAEHLRMLHQAGRTALLQPYLGEVDRLGETALVYFGAQYSHAARKASLLAPGTVHSLQAGSRELFVGERMSRATASPVQRAVADRAVAFLAERFDGDLLYTRVDLLPGRDGPVVIELEAVEPSLFLSYADGAAERFARAAAERIDHTERVGSDAR